VGRNKRLREAMKRQASARAQPEEMPKVVLRPTMRKIEVTAPDQINLQRLAVLYRLEGMKLGLQIACGLPDGVLERVNSGEVPAKINTKKLLTMIGEGLRSALRGATGKLDKLHETIEQLSGYVPTDEQTEKELLSPDLLVRLVNIPEEDGGGWMAELDPGCRDDGETPGEALGHLAKWIDDYLNEDQ